MQEVTTVFASRGVAATRSGGPTTCRLYAVECLAAASHCRWSAACS